MQLTCYFFLVLFQWLDNGWAKTELKCWQWVLDGRLIEKEMEAASLWLCGSVASGKIAFSGEESMFDSFSSLLMADYQSIKSNNTQLSIK